MFACQGEVQYEERGKLHTTIKVIAPSLDVVLLWINSFYGPRKNTTFFYDPQKFALSYLALFSISIPSLALCSPCQLTHVKSNLWFFILFS